MTGQPQLKANDKRRRFVFGLISNLAVNGFSLIWALGWLWLGALGAGMSSGPVEQLKEIWNSFVMVASCCPLTLNLLLFMMLLVLALKQRDRMILLGWLTGLVISGLAGLAAGGAIMALIYGLTLV
jgi:hypothetical protein